MRERKGAKSAQLKCSTVLTVEVRQLKAAEGNLFGGVSWRTTMQNENSGRAQQFQSQVHIRTSPDASPENVDVFVGSDSTNPVTAPCA